MPVSVASVPAVGKVTFVVPVVVKVVLKAPTVVRLPPSVIVRDPLLTPVPPFEGSMIVALHVSVVMVPTVINALEPANGDLDCILLCTAGNESV